MNDSISRRKAIKLILGGKLDPEDSLVECAEECNSMLDWAADEIEALPSEPRWIPVTERLPEKHGEECLVTINDGGIYTTSAQYDVKHKQWYFSYYDKAVGERFRILTDNVTAWMPMPEPWKGEDDAKNDSN